MLGCEFVGLGGFDLLVFRRFRRFDRSQYLSGCFLNEAETRHEQVSITVVEMDVVHCGIVGGKSERRADHESDCLRFSLTDDDAGVFAAIATVQELVTLC